MKSFRETIHFDDIKIGDTIYIDYKNQGSYDHFKVTEEGFFNIFKHQNFEFLPIDFEKEFLIYKQNFRFISKPNEWYLTGTEAFLESDWWGPTDKIEDLAAVFRGWKKDEKDGLIGGDGESCLFDEFDIIPYENETKS